MPANSRWDLIRRLKVKIAGVNSSGRVVNRKHQTVCLCASCLPALCALHSIIRKVCLCYFRRESDQTAS